MEQATALACLHLANLSLLLYLEGQPCRQIKHFKHFRTRVSSRQRKLCKSDQIPIKFMYHQLCQELYCLPWSSIDPQRNNFLNLFLTKYDIPVCHEGIHSKSKSRDPNDPAKKFELSSNLFKNATKWPKNGQKLPKMTQCGPNMTQNGPKWQ